MGKSLAVAVGIAGAMLSVPLHAGEEGGEEKALPLLPTLVPMKEISVPIVDAGRIEGVLRFTLVLRAQDAAGAILLTNAEPKLRAAALDAGMEFARLRASPLRAVDAEQLAADMDRALHAADAGVAQALIIRVIATAD